jgi:hypothetical protein
METPFAARVSTTPIVLTMASSSLPSPTPLSLSELLLLLLLLSLKLLLISIVAEGCSNEVVVVALQTDSFGTYAVSVTIALMIKTSTSPGLSVYTKLRFSSCEVGMEDGFERMSELSSGYSERLAPKSVVWEMRMDSAGTEEVELPDREIDIGLRAEVELELLGVDVEGGEVMDGMEVVADGLDDEVVVGAEVEDEVEVVIVCAASADSISLSHAAPLALRIEASTVNPRS